MTPEITARLDICLRLADRLARQREALIAAAAEDAGIPCRVAAIEVDLGVEHLRTMEVEAPHVEGKTPYGTVAAILPYDAPPVMLARVGGAAILGGNRFRFSLSSHTPLTARILEEVVAPFPEFEAVVGLDNRTFGDKCLHDPQVRVFFISGGGGVGAAYAREAHRFDKLFFAGPGGMPAAILFKDAPLEAATRFVVRRAFINGGQYCTTIKKAYIHQDIFAAAKDMILSRMPEIKVGDPMDPATWIGPIKVERTRKLLLNALAQLKEPHFLVPYRQDGEWVGPYLMETSEVPDLEMFGPFLALIPVADDTEAAARAQVTRYPFLCVFFGTPPPGAKAGLTETFGMVHDNPDFLFTPMRLPFGGKKESGWIIENKNGQPTRRDGAFIYAKELVRG